MPIERTWKYLRHNDDGGSARSLRVLPEDFTRVEDAQRFSQAEIATMNTCAVDYIQADERWYSAYKVFVAEEHRRFLVCLANYIYNEVVAPHARPWVGAQDFYKHFMSQRGGGKKERSLRDLSTAYDEADFVSSEKEDNATMLYFTAWQKRALLIAMGVRKNTPTQEAVTVKFLNQHLSGPSK
ncbi:hypothetical protein FHX10_006533 [Rhizobium sp. BK591]|uniref:hypothetical protein n=1 Tax=Rhizobium sp. BK591 TaxID=2586985 RepID=UPI0010485EED|nr:hypothetical protein [Rhizobium sp. BK591]MBB3746980.1 hypothetical protein [Rhizobium sp. BK591]